MEIESTDNECKFIDNKHICNCDKINWLIYNELEHNLSKCNSCYCKYIREEISYEQYEEICLLSFKNNGRKFKDICMVAT